jgi:hypothetical protein
MFFEKMGPNCFGASAMCLPVSFPVVGFWWQLKHERLAILRPRAIFSGVTSTRRSILPGGYWGFR